MEFLSYLISGISLGSIYAIIALGYTMVYGIAKMLNFAHGDIIMIGGYVSFCSMYYLNLPPIVATLLAVIACTVLGIVIERLAYAPLRSAPSLAVLITAIGVSYFLQNSALLIWKAAAKTYPPVVAGAVQLFNGQLTISYISLLTIAACVVIMLALTTFVSKSKMGKAMRACSEDKGAAQLMGINVNSTISATFAIGSALAAIAGVLLLFGVHFLLQRQRLGVTAAVACAFYLLTSFAGLAAEQGNAYLCIGSSSALLYDTHYALLVGTPDQSAYYAYTRILQNRRLQLVAVYLPDDRVGYYTRALTTAVHPVNVLLPGGNTALAVQPECEHLLTATAMDTTPWQGVQVQYRYNKKRYTVSITCKGKRLVLGNGTDLNGGDLTVAFGKQSTAVGMLVRAGVLAEDELLTVTLRQDSALRIRRNDPWL